MTIHQQQLSDGVWAVAVQGRLDQSQNPALEQQLLALLAQGSGKLIVDLSETTYINSGGLRTLVAAWRKAKRQEGDLVLCGLSPRLHELFRMVGFDKVFQIFPTRSAAEAANHL